MLDEHRIEGAAVVPGVGYLDLARAAFADALGAGPAEIKDVVFLAPLDVGERREVRVVLRVDGQQAAFVVSARSGGGWTDFATGNLKRLADSTPPGRELSEIRDRCRAGEVTFSVSDHQGVVRVGPHWDTVARVLQGDGEELAELRLPEQYAAEVAGYWLHPSLLDGATSFAQTLGPTEGSYLPFGYGSIRVFAPLPATFFSHIRHRKDTSAGSFLTCDISLLDGAGTTLVEIEGFTLRKVDAGAVVAGMAQERPEAPKAEQPARNLGGPGELDFGISPAEALEVFDTVLRAWPAPQVAICPEHLHRKIARAKGLTQRFLLEQIAEAKTPVVVQVERSLDTPIVEPETELERTLAALWQETLGVSPIGVEDDFFELGGNSLIAVQVASRVRERFQIELALPSLFEQPTVRRLAGLVEEALVKRVAAMSDEEAREALARIGAGG
jgi:acyl carrier protein